jgi:broad specificity phosphatase PhoE
MYVIFLLLDLARYFALRHGQSEANIEGIISSDPVGGTIKHGLTASGRAQARAAATQLIEVCCIYNCQPLHVSVVASALVTACRYGCRRCDFRCVSRVT